jgi:hypothetical protein
MMDMVFSVATAFFVVLGVGYVYACERLGAKAKNEPK